MSPKDGAFPSVLRERWKPKLGAKQYEVMWCDKMLIACDWK